MHTIQTVMYKLGRMRKEREWTIMPTTKDRILVQTDGAIGAFDPETGKGMLSTEGEFFYHLQARSKPFDFPRDFVTLCMKACPPLGSITELGGGVVRVINAIEEF